MSKAELIEKIMQADPATLEAMEKAAKGAATKTRTGTIKDAAQILECCTRSVVRYAQQGLIRQIKITPRKIRYDLNEVERLATQGADALGAR